MLEAGAALAGGRYVVLRLLDRGGMGCVYQAVQPALGDRLVAVKEMDVHIADPSERQMALDHFKREATMLASLEHPGLVQVADCFEEAGTAYLVMSYVDGTTLAQALDEAKGFLPVEHVLGWVDQVAEVLQYLHQRTPPIIFRDLKPRNVMVDRHGRIKLIDFGIARFFDPQTATSTFIRAAGTPGYAPVEQYTGGRTDARTDIYSLGATIYTLLTRTVPPLSVARMSGEVHLEAPRALNPAISPALEAAVLKMMALQRDDRFASVAEVRQVLQSFRDVTITSLAPCLTCGVPQPPGASACSSCGARRAPLVPSESPTDPRTSRAGHQSPSNPDDVPLVSGTRSGTLAVAARQAAEGGLGTAVIGLAVLLFIGAVFGTYDLAPMLLFILKASLVSVAAGLASHLLERALVGSIGYSLVRQLLAAIASSVVAGALACAVTADPDWLIIGPAAAGIGGGFSAILTRPNGRVVAAALMGGLLGTWMWRTYPMFWLNGAMLYVGLRVLTHSEWGIFLPMGGSFVGAIIGMLQPASTSRGTSP